MKVITVATEKNGYYLSLEESAKKLDYELILLGLGMKWKGFGWRVKMVLEYLQKSLMNSSMNEDDVFMMVDAYDVVLLRSSKDALNEYASMGVPFLCGGFRKIDGLVGKIQQEEFGHSFKNRVPKPYNNLCAGTWLSTVRVTLDIWGGEQIPDIFDDQIYLNKLFNRQEKMVIYPDYNFRIFCTLFPNLLDRKIRDEDKIYTRNGKLFCGKTNTYPIVLHGLANMDLQHILFKLNFENVEDLTQVSYHIDKTLYHINTSFKNSYTFQTIVIIVIILLSCIICVGIAKMKVSYQTL